MNKRQERIIKLLDDSKSWITGKELSRLMDVSDRTIRSDMDSINRHYGKSLIESSVKNGYRINSEVMASLPIEVTPLIPQTPQERCTFMIQELLKKKEINLLDLQDQVYISGYTIDNDLKKIRKQLEPYEGLKIVRSKNYIRLHGNEESKRKLYKDLLEQETRGNFLNLNGLASLFSDFDLMYIKQVLEEVLSSYDYRVRDTAFPMLLMHVGVSIERMIHHNYVNQDINQQVKNSLEYQIFHDFFCQLTKTIRIEYIEEEVCMLALLLMGRRSKDYTRDEVELHGHWYRVSELIDRMLESIHDEFGIDFQEDQDLRNGLGMHVRSLLERKRKAVYIENVYLKEVKRRYPLVFELGIQAGRALSDQIGSEIGENEIGFLALHLGSAYEKSRSYNKYKVLMIFPDDMALSEFCARKVETGFSERMEIIDCVSMFEQKQVEKLSPDLILTTLPLKHNLDILTVQISPLIDHEDESHIFQALNQLDKQKGKKQFENLILDLIKPDYFYPDLQIDSPQHMIHHMCTAMAKDHYIDQSFENSVMERENISSTSFSYGFALPHALNMEAKKSCISVAILKTPMNWGEYSVRLVILLAIRDVDRKLLRVFFDWLSSVVSDSVKMSRLLQAKSREEFLERILED